MCRLYSLAATHPTRIHCELIEAQNSLIRQAENDGRGLSNPDGWGIAYFDGDELHRVRDVDPAENDEDFRRESAQVEACTAIAHIRRATVGEPKLANTHPFIHGDSMLAHNGHIPEFEVVKERMLEAMSAEHRQAIDGSTDSEHFFHLLLSNYEGRSNTPMIGALRDTVRQVLEWCEETDTDEAPALNILWAVRGRLAGVRFGRTLWWVDTQDNRECPVCGRRHARVPDGEAYRSIEVASERITAEDWRPVPERSVFEVTDSKAIEFVALD